MAHIKVWCEYDFGGSFGGNNDEDIFEIPSGLSVHQVRQLIVAHLKQAAGVEEDDLEGLYDWEHVSIKKLGE